MENNLCGESALQANENMRCICIGNIYVQLEKPILQTCFTRHWTAETLNYYDIALLMVEH